MGEKLIDTLERADARLYLAKAAKRPDRADGSRVGGHPMPQILPVSAIR